VLAVLASDSIAQLPFPNTLYVNAETGDDSGPGSATNPYQTLNKALQQAYDINPSGATVINKIKVYFSEHPIAPVGYGGQVGGVEAGHEAEGWVAVGEPPRKPFPIRMLAGVDIIGVPERTTQALPIITIDELGAAGGPADYLDMQPGEPSCVVRRAANAALKTFDIDGSRRLLSVVNESRWPGILAIGVSDFTVQDCDVRAWQDGVCLEAKEGQTLSALIDGCTLRDSFLITPVQYGHAGLWMIGDGTLTVDITDSTITNCHDAVEMGMEVGTVSTFSMSGSFVHDNENGLEVVGDGGSMNLTLLSTKFCRNYSKGLPLGGIATTTSTGALLFGRSTPQPGPITVTASIRSCDFSDNGWVVPWNQMGSLDLGTDTSPGLNNFCIDYASFLPNMEPFRVQLYQVFGGPVTASGNYWVRSNQGANASGQITGTVVAGQNGVNLINGLPPGPLVGEIDPATSLPYLRNFSIGPFNSIDFGSVPAPGTPPDCLTVPCTPSGG